jgi:hypothetical protein
MKVPVRGKGAPILAHYGYRGPTHFHKKYHPGMGDFHSRYTDWDLRSPESVEKTCFFFNGTWNGTLHPMSREGWESRSEWKRKRS